MMNGVLVCQSCYLELSALTVFYLNAFIFFLSALLMVWRWFFIICCFFILYAFNIVLFPYGLNIMLFVVNFLFVLGFSEHFKWAYASISIHCQGKCLEIIRLYNIIVTRICNYFWCSVVIYYSLQFIVDCGYTYASHWLPIAAKRESQYKWLIFI